MTDLDNALRTMLHERADDIETLPADFAHLESMDVLDFDREQDTRVRRRTGWLVAAAVAAVLAVVGTAVAIRSSGGGKVAPATHAPTASHTTPAPAPANHAARDIDLAWFGMATLPGYQLGEETSVPGYRQLGVKPGTDHDLPPGCNGCAPWTAYITVYAPGKFDARTAEHWTKVGSGARVRYIGTITEVGGSGDARTLAWQYGPDRWAIVQGLTPATRSTAALSKIADAVRPDESVPLQLPLRLGYLPAPMPITNAYQDLTGQYPTQLGLGPADPIDNGEDPSLQISVYRASSFDGIVDTSKMTPQTIGGLAGYVDVGNGTAAARIAPNIIMSIGYAEAGGTVPPSYREPFLRMLHSITWLGATAEIPAEQAIP